ncbi:TonB-dependent receptor [Ramlibacter solisilvae]|uniref:Porin n=1 Tax=Ramlibacter tataouinensis TaxID=94132 RepID=A0A127JWK0_9BURK|nr:hypothetical protein [Ramlibacter tataouinensis]AMO24275.1 hypothetical protein UC35_17290 [Ramlibacter tataouinensis]
MNPLLRAACLLALAAPCLSKADTAADLQALRDEIKAMRSQYEERIRSLESRLQAAETAAQATPPAPAPPAPAPPAPAPAAAAAPAAASAAPGSGTGFNPALSLILSGLYTNTSRDPATYRISGFALPPDAEVGPGTRSFSLAESEVTLSANVDPWFSGVATLSFAPDNSVSVEEAFIQTTSLGRGLTLKAGRFLSSIGYLNSQHKHVWDFVDAPLAYQAMLGTQYGDDGVQLAWLAPTDQYLELRGELGGGRSFPAGGWSGNGAGTSALSLHTGGDIGESSNWRAGLSVLDAKASDQRLLGPDAFSSGRADAFSGRTRVWIADAVWKWAPQGNATRTNFKLQGEYLRSTRDGTLVADVDALASSTPYRAVQSGWYLQGVYQFMPRWRVGLRTERLDPGSPDYADNAAFFAPDGWRPRRNSAMLDWNPSEFSRVRLQYAQDRARPGSADNQWFLQYQMSLGAHGAHGY